MKKKIYRIVFLGSQGSGKGTQAELLAKRLKIPTISVGNLFREHIKNKTEIGEIVKMYLDQGKLAPTKIATKMIEARLSEDDCKKGFILDGYPRNKMQFNALIKFIEITHAIEIQISDEEAIHRISGRRVCSVCGKNYHLIYNLPKQDEICDICKIKLKIRDDDKPKSIKIRLKIYHKHTKPLIDLFKKQGIFIRVNGEKSIKEVNKEIKRVFGVK
jgi:adenylate kinase